MTNIRKVLEENRARLSRKLIDKEAEINRLHVKLKNLSRTCEGYKFEANFLRKKANKPIDNQQLSADVKSELLINQMPSVGSFGTTTDDSTEGAKKSSIQKLEKAQFHLDEILADPYKTKLYVEKLRKQIERQV